MKKPDLAHQLALSSGLSDAEAADRVDDLVHEILRRLRRGKPAALPGLGKLLPPQKPRPRAKSPRRPK